MPRRFMGALLALAALAACTDSAPLTPAEADPAATVVPGERLALEVKFRAGLRVRLDNGALVSASGAALDRVAALLDPAAGVRVSPLFNEQALAVDRLAGVAAAASGEAAPDLGSWYRVVLPADADVEKLLADLQARPEVEHAYRAPVPAPPPGFAALFVTPDFSGDQLYLGTPPIGTDAAWARTVPGGAGAGVMIVDLEYNWHLGHEDLALPASAQIGTSQRYTVFGNDHGTAVLGELVGRANGFGVTGAVPDADARVIPVHYAGAYIPANAIAEAAAVMSPGDVLLLEAQYWGPTGNYVPLEVLQSVFDATRAATLTGRIVVAAAGNGGENLDAPVMGGLFNRNLRDSGAIIVGAGSWLQQRLYFSCYGSRVDVQGWGQGVVTAGYGGLFGTGPDNYYTATFSGTSSASPIVAAAAVAVQGRRKALGLPVLTSVQMRSLLRDTGSPQTGDLSQPIGPFPNVRAAFGEATTPGVPGAVDVGLLSGTSARLSWAAGAGATHFQVARQRLSAAQTWNPWVALSTPGAAARAFTDSGLVAGGTYRYRVRACIGASCSAWAVSPAIDLVPPAPPANLAGTPVSSTQARLTWLDGSGNETGFRLYRRRSLGEGAWSAYQEVGAPPRNATSFIDSGLEAGVAYRYRVEACNPSGCSAAAFSPSVTPPETPAAPGPVRATALSPTRAQVTWTDASANETRFEVGRRLQNGDGGWGVLVTVASPAANVVSAVDNGALAGQYYLYYVRACRGVACSAWTRSPVLQMP